MTFRCGAPAMHPRSARRSLQEQEWRATEASSPRQASRLAARCRPRRRAHACKRLCLPRR
eukprot:887588-Pleurochrysis_carterae.AAC.1